MADKVIYQDGDDLSETNLALMLAVGNQTDYKERGFGFNPDWTNNDLTIGTTDQWGNFANIEDAKQAYYLLADQRTVSLPNTNGKNYVYLHHDPTQGDHIGIHVDSNQTPPTNPSLLIGTVDTSNQTYDDTINDSPGGEFESVTTEGVRINEEYLWASSYNGADADARLTNALSDATNGDCIHLENATYSSDRSITTRITLIGPAGNFSGIDISGTWTFDTPQVTVKRVRFSVDPAFNQNRTRFNEVMFNANITNGGMNNQSYVACDFNSNSLTLESGSSNCIVDGVVQGTVTDNGTNVVGEIS